MLWWRLAPRFFVDYSESRNTVSKFFLLGAAGDGDFSNRTPGSLTGTLQAGRTDEFLFNDLIQAILRADAGATATGCMTLSSGGSTGGGTCGVPSMFPSVASARTELGGTSLRMQRNDRRLA